MKLDIKRLGHTTSKSVTTVEPAKRIASQAEKTSGGPKPERPVRLMLGLDATSSRQTALLESRRATATMLKAMKELDTPPWLKLVYFQGESCREGQWTRDAQSVEAAMNKIHCRAGRTQYRKVLAVAGRESIELPLGALVLIGDHCEENGQELLRMTSDFKDRRTPIFVFQEITDHNQAAIAARPVFEALASATNGAYVELNCDSGNALRELLINVAAYASGGDTLRRAPAASTPEGKELRAKLLALPPPDRRGLPGPPE